MFENIIKFFKKAKKSEEKPANSKSAAKERLHLVLMQDRANVSADFLELMKQEIIEVIKKYIEVDESAIDVRLTNKENEDGTNGAPALYANIPIVNIKNEARKVDAKKEKNENEKTNEENKDVKKEENEQKKQEELKKESNEKNEVENKENLQEEVKKENTTNDKETKEETTEK
ncbi:MAG TPA: cell division topological specificity factor MinE [Clostridiaceae bacterium]|nr:cell division topological specificity factor MinE [Clostridiaceae bacterium]